MKFGLGSLDFGLRSFDSPLPARGEGKGVGVGLTPTSPLFPLSACGEGERKR
jgi:hypothetical protein